MAGVNKVILIGNLGKDPEERHFEGGRVKVSFPLATSETYKNREGEKVEATEWHNIVLWNKLGEIAAKYLHKGDKVFIEGKIRTRSWEDGGVKKYMTEINNCLQSVWNVEGLSESQTAGLSANVGIWVSSLLAIGIYGKIVRILNFVIYPNIKKENE